VVGDISIYGVGAGVGVIISRDAALLRLYCVHSSIDDTPSTRCAGGVVYLVGYGVGVGVRER
jgi:hypothetical protein